MPEMRGSANEAICSKISHCEAQLTRLYGQLPDFQTAKPAPRTAYESAYRQRLALKPDPATYIPVFSAAKSANSDKARANERLVEAKATSPAKTTTDQQYEKIIASLRAEASKLREQNAFVVKKAEELCFVNQKLQTLNSELQQDLARKNDELAAGIQRLGTTEQRIGVLEEQRARQVREMQTLKTKMDEQAAENAASQRQNDYLQHKIKIFEKDAELARQKLEIAAEQNAELLARSQQAAKNEARLDELRMALTQRENDVSALATQSRLLEEEIQRLQTFTEPETPEKDSELSYSTGSEQAPAQESQHTAEDDAINNQFELMQRMLEVQRLVQQNQLQIDCLAEDDDYELKQSLADANSQLLEQCGEIRELRGIVNQQNTQIATLKADLAAERQLNGVPEEALQQIELLRDQLKTERSLTEKIQSQLANLATGGLQALAASERAGRDAIKQQDEPCGIEQKLTTDGVQQANLGNTSAQELEIELLQRRIAQEQRHFADMQDADLAELHRARSALAIEQEAGRRREQQLRDTLSCNTTLQNKVEDLEFQLALFGDDEDAAQQARLYAEAEQSALRVQFLRGQLARCVVRCLGVE